jgi:hypothetical protein
MSKSKASFLGMLLTLTAIMAISLIVMVARARALSSSHDSFNEQAEKKLITEETPAPPFQPIKIIGVKVKKQPVELGKEFDGDDDWLRGAEIRLKNVSQKEIVHVRIHINFPETKATGYEMSFRRSLGKRPGEDSPLREPISIPPGAEFNFVIDEKQYEELTRFVSTRQAVASIKKAQVMVGFVIFADGTGWGAGTFYRQDPNNPKQYLPVIPRQNGNDH